MSTEKTDALIIRLADFSESSKVVTCFTRDFGKTAALAKGGRRLKSAFEAALDLLTACRIVFIRKSGPALDILTEAQLVTRFTPNRKNLTSLYAGYFIAELLDALTELHDPHPRLFDSAQEALDQLSHEEDHRLPLIRFQLILLREIGLIPIFDQCISCGRDASESGLWTHWVGRGGLLCSQCRTHAESPNDIQAGTVALLRRLSQQPDLPTSRLAASSQQMRQMQHILTSALTHALGRRPKTLRYLNFQ